MKIKPEQDLDTVPPLPTMSKARILKNVVVLSTGVMVLFIAYDGLTMLQSTMNSEQGIGVISQAVLYICFCMSALVFPKYVIKKLGSKLTLVLSMVSYVPYVGSNFYPHWSVMMPTSILLGFGAALLWGSQANYLNDVSVLYAELLLVSGKDPEVEKGNVDVGGSQPNSGCRCISCVYVEYDGSDSCPLEDQLKGGPTKSEVSQEKVTSLPTSIDKSTLGHPLSSSECRSSSKTENLRELNPKNLVQKIEEHSKNHSNSNKTGEKDNRISNQNSSFQSKVDLKYCNVDISDNHCDLNAKDSAHKIEERESEHYELAGGEGNSEQNHNLSSKSKVDVECRSPRKVENVNSQIRNNSIPNNRTDNLVSTDGKCEPNQYLSSKPKVSLESLSSCKIENSCERNQNNMSLKNNESCNENRGPNTNKSSKSKVHTHRSKAIESTTARFFGFHGLAFLSCGVWINLLSYFILQGDDNRPFNSSLNNSFVDCGADFCGFESVEQQTRQMPSDTARYALTGICVCLGLAAVLFVGLFLDPLDDKSDDGEGFSLRLLTATVRLAKRTELLLLMPLSMYLGMAKGFYTSDFTKAFVSCALGPSYVGLVAVCYGASCALFALVSGWAVRRVGRPILFTGSALVNASACILLLTWTPDPERPIFFFGVAAMWGFHVGTVWSQIRAFYGVLFKADEEAAFATFHTWFSLGFCLSFAYSNFLCTHVKIYVLLAVSTIGFAGYFLVERRHAGNMRKQ